MPLKIFINGRFLSQSLTGVQRYAAEMVKAMDRLLASGEAPQPLLEAEWRILAPPNATAAIDLKFIQTSKVGRQTGHAWDQVDLARAAWDGRLISLANSGPVVHRNQLVVIHDAQVFRRPDFFSRSYLAVHRTLGYLLARRADIATVSDFSRRELAGALWLKPADIPVFSNSAEHFAATVPDFGVIERLGLVPHRFFLSVGSMTRNKNISLAIQAAQQLGRPDIPLVVVGGDNNNEKAKFETLKAKEIHRLAHEAVRVRASYVEQKAKDVNERTGMSMIAAKCIIERQFKGILLPDVVLPFDDEEFAGCNVADVLADPDHFEGATLADPNEGPDYGYCVAKILRRPDGTPWIHSFAHGRTVYELKYDAAAVRSAIEKADKAVAVKTLVDLAVLADLNEQGLEELRDLTAKCSGTGKQTIKTMLKAAQKEHAAERAKHEHKRRAAERSDPRPQIDNPAIDAPWLPQMQVLNDVLGSSPAKIPPARNIDDDITRARKLRVPNTHAFTNANGHPEE